MICSICLQTYEEICIECLRDQSTCVLCYDTFRTEDEVIQCKECQYLGHATNFKNWLKDQGYCPVCKSKYSDQQFSYIALKDQTITNLLLAKSSIFEKRKEIFKKFKFQLPYYNFQQEVLEDILVQFGYETSHLLVSPPGSGKTIIALSIASQLNLSTIILVPSESILGSWIDRLSMFYDSKSSQISLKSVYSTHINQLRPITLMTYDQLHEILIENQTDPDIDESGKVNLLGYRPSMSYLYESQIGMIIVDETHRLLGQYGQDLIKLIEHVGQVKLLGLTATMPLEADLNFEALFDEGITQIPLPMLVREGVLVPYRDIAISLPSDTEIFRLDELTNSEAIDDLHLKNYGKLIEKFMKRITQEIRLLDLVSKEDREHATWLSANLSVKTLLTIFILIREIGLLRNNFRGLILLENENLPMNYNLDQKGIGGSIGIFKDLIAVPEILDLNPILITGKSVIIHDNFIETFIESGKMWLDLHNLDVKLDIHNTTREYEIVNASGPDWNISTYTRFVTSLFEIGISKLLIGSHFLLGEGWDSQSLNTMVDLTTFSSYEKVNQAKGRTLRKDPNFPEKVAHIWEFAPNPKLTDFGSKAYEEFVSRHSVYFGVDNAGRIRGGVDRLGLTYHQFNDYLKLKLIGISNRSSIKWIWKVGKKLGDLFYTLRIAYKIPIPSAVEVREALISAIEDGFKSICNSHLDSKYRIVFDKAENRTSSEIKLIIYIPTEENYDNILNVRKLLENTDRQIGLALYIIGYKSESIKWTGHSTTKIGSFLNIINNTRKMIVGYIPGSTRRVSHHKHLLMLPIPDIDRSSYSLQEGNWKNDVDLFLKKNIKEKINPNLKITQKSPTWNAETYIFYDYYTIDLVSFSNMFKGYEDIIFPRVDQGTVLEVESLVLDQEYVDRIFG